MIVRRLRSKGATATVTAYGEVLFMPGGQMHGWLRRFGNRAARYSGDAAPSNKRPRWAHYGKPLKETMFSSNARTRIMGPDRMRVYAAVGSNAPHAYYVDQGTKDFNAKILPPWQRNSPSLYEHTFQVPTTVRGSGGWNEWEEVGKIRVRGQKGQQFMARGVDRAFLYMTRRAAQVRTDPRIGKVMDAWPAGLEGFKGNTPDTPAFRAQLEEWRAWRDEAWRAGRILGRGYVRERERREYRAIKRTTDKYVGRDLADFRWRQEQAAKRRARRAAAARDYRARRKAQTRNSPAAQQAAAIAAARIKFMQRVLARYGDASNRTRIGNPKFVRAGGVGYWQVNVTIRNGETKTLVDKNKFKV